MSLLLHDGEVIEIPEYIIRIINKAQQIVRDEESHPVFNISDQDSLARLRNGEFEPVLIGKNGCKQTVSEYILGIIRSAQKIIQEDESLDDDIKDYDEFIDSTFDSMLNEVDSDIIETSSNVAQNIENKLIDEVCNTKIVMPVLENSLISSVQEEEHPPLDNQQNLEEQADNSKTGEIPSEMEDAVKDDADHITKDDENSIETSDNTINVMTTVDSTKQNEDLYDKEEPESIKEENKNCENINEDTTENTSKIVPSQSELEHIAEKFVESICNDAKNELLIESQNSSNEEAESSNDAVKCTEESDKTDTNIEAANGQVEQIPEESTDKKDQNNTSKVHPEETKPVVEDITKSDSLPTEGKHGKEQKYEVSKDKIKPKRRSRGLRNSFRRMFSCFSTKSSQLE